MKRYCVLCETEALYYYLSHRGEKVYLCFTHMDAFTFGQMNPDAVIETIQGTEDKSD